MSDDLRGRQLVIDTARAMAACGLNHGACGNVSQRVNDGMLITPSGLQYDAMQTADVVFLSLDGKWKEGARPSSEWRFHRDIYLQREDAGAVLHAHSPWCTTLACLQRGIPSFHYMVAIAGGKDIRCAPYATFGSQMLSQHALTALEGRDACLLANHGLLCLATDLPGAIALAVEVEFLARVYCQSLALGNPVCLEEQEMARVVDKFRHYGAKLVANGPPGPSR